MTPPTNNDPEMSGSGAAVGLSTIMNACHSDRRVGQLCDIAMSTALESHTVEERVLLVALVVAD